jgi:hypothetical protein
MWTLIVRPFFPSILPPSLTVHLVSGSCPWRSGHRPLPSNHAACGEGRHYGEGVVVRGVRRGLHLGPPRRVATTDFQPNTAPIGDPHRRSLVLMARPLGTALEHFLLAPHPLPSRGGPAHGHRPACKGGKGAAASARPRWETTARKGV